MTKEITAKKEEDQEEETSWQDEISNWTKQWEAGGRDLFARYWWPGNVRQLRNEIQRAVAMSPNGSAIEPRHLSPDLGTPDSGPPVGNHGGAAPLQPGNLSTVIERVEREMITATLAQTQGNISESARVLGLTRRGLYLKMNRLGLDGAMADTQ